MKLSDERKNGSTTFNDQQSAHHDVTSNNIKNVDPVDCERRGMGVHVRQSLCDMSNTRTARLLGQHWKGAVADSTAAPNCCAKVRSINLPTKIFDHNTLRLQMASRVWQPPHKRVRISPIAVRIQQWTEVLRCHPRRPPCYTSSGASEIPPAPFSTKLNGWCSRTSRGRGSRGSEGRLRAGLATLVMWRRSQVRPDLLPTSRVLLRAPDNAPKCTIVQRGLPTGLWWEHVCDSTRPQQLSPHNHGSQSANQPNPLGNRKVVCQQPGQVREATSGEEAQTTSTLTSSTLVSSGRPNSIFTQCETHRGTVCLTHKERW